MGLIELGYFGLFSGTFLSATILPFPSDVIVIGFYELDYPIVTCLIVATIGNLLGGLTNYYIGYKANNEKLKKKFKLNEEKLKKWEMRLARWGIYLGLISWFPFVGEPMVAALGFFKVRLLPLALMMLIGKFFRYFMLTMIYLNV
ncbi:DedA family protein [Paracrocinitomix mangrovi]|uniref:YqaA family protein n=1 Tax=Paracrocinitomix mangrovi TaxID=2862509 RepID=UPI001C8D60FB|nr:YqaA family protein [Paracrocinitomix mangrovi]UKN00239.1 DedA family protein [Paracrocinitomix mangrovi]